MSIVHDIEKDVEKIVNDALSPVKTLIEGIGSKVEGLQNDVDPKLFGLSSDLNNALKSLESLTSYASDVPSDIDSIINVIKGYESDIAKAVSSATSKLDSASFSNVFSSSQFDNDIARLVSTVEDDVQLAESLFSRSEISALQNWVESNIVGTSSSTQKQDIVNVINDIQGVVEKTAGLIGQSIPTFVTNDIKLIESVLESLPDKVISVLANRMPMDDLNGMVSTLNSNFAAIQSAYQGIPQEKLSSRRLAAVKFGVGVGGGSEPTAAKAASEVLVALKGVASVLIDILDRFATSFPLEVAINEDTGAAVTTGMNAGVAAVAEVAGKAGIGLNQSLGFSIKAFGVSAFITSIVNILLNIFVTASDTIVTDIFLGYDG